MTDPGSMLSVAHEALDLARSLLLSGGPESVSEKEERDYVTDRDILIERRVREFLRSRNPAIDFLGEEEAHGKPDSALTWVLDPIDGTSNYIHNVPLCAVSLALMAEGEPVLGAIDLPFLGDRRYHAVAGSGAFMNKSIISVNNGDSLRKAMVAVGDYATGRAAQAKNRARLAVTTRLVPMVERVRMFGSAAIDLAWVADGRVDAAVMLTNKPWDTAAGVVLAREAGARVVDRYGAEHSIDSGSTVAASPGMIGQLIELLHHAELDTGVVEGAQ
jgi:myo-inositol-1(or 4)-monophosphatase